MLGKFPQWYKAGTMGGTAGLSIEAKITQLESTSCSIVR